MPTSAMEVVCFDAPQHTASKTHFLNIISLLPNARDIVVSDPLVSLEGVRHLLLWIADDGPTTLREVHADLVETEHTRFPRVGSGSSRARGWRANPVVTRVCQGEGSTIGGNAEDELVP